MKRVFCLLLTALMLLPLAACGRSAEPVSRDLFAMDTYMTLVAYGEEADAALTECCQAINLLEAEISRTREGSDVDVLNRTGTWQGSGDGTDCTADILQKALRYSDETDGRFDVTIAPLVLLWNITGDTPYVPTQDEIDTLLPLVGSDHLHLSGNTAALDEGCSVDLGGIGKGYASDLVRDIMTAHKVKSGTVSLGGNVYVRGVRPDGKLWTVAIQDPENPEGFAAYISLSDAFVVTSGGYQRHFTAPDGTEYQHILDPRTGAPAQSDLTSVSIITADSGTRADAYSTALYVMGEEEAIDFWRSRGDFDMILITADGRLLYTPGLTIKQPEGSGYDFQAIA